MTPCPCRRLQRRPPHRRLLVPARDRGRHHLAWHCQRRFVGKPGDDGRLCSGWYAGDKSTATVANDVLFHGDPDRRTVSGSTRPGNGVGRRLRARPLRWHPWDASWWGSTPPSAPAAPWSGPPAGGSARGRHREGGRRLELHRPGGPLTGHDFTPARSTTPPPRLRWPGSWTACGPPTRRSPRSTSRSRVVNHPPAWGPAGGCRGRRPVVVGARGSGREGSCCSAGQPSGGRAQSCPRRGRPRPGWNDHRRAAVPQVSRLSRSAGQPLVMAGVDAREERLGEVVAGAHHEVDLR